MAVTIKDIAKAAGVSHTTVSRALRGSHLISAETIKRVQKIALELGYVPNTVARGLKTKRSGALGVIVRRIVDPYFAEVLQGIEDVLQASDYSLFLAASHRDPKREEAVMRAMSERRVDGVIICSTQVSEEHRRQLEHFGVLSVLINNQAIEETGRSIYHDDTGGSRQLAQHLIDLGHTRIGYLGNARAGRTNDDRLSGYKQALENAGIPFHPGYVQIGPNGQAGGGAAGVQSFLTLAERPSAIMCFNDMMAIGAMQTLYEAGLQVPQDCSITGFDNIELAGFVRPTLTTFDQPKYKIGREAAQMMLRLLDNQQDKEMASHILMLKGKLEVRQSTAVPPNATGSIKS